MSTRKAPEEGTGATIIPLNRAGAHHAHAADPHVVRQEVTHDVTAMPDFADSLLHGATPAKGPRNRFARQIYPLRVLGLGLGFLCVAGTLQEVGAPAWGWVVLVLHGFAWPHLAFWWASSSHKPRRAEYASLAFDSVMGGIWVAAMHVAIVPSAVLVSMLVMDKAAVGGWRLMLKCVALQALGFGAAWIALGMPFQPESGRVAVLASLPLIAAYPLAIAFAVHALGRRVREQNRSLRALNRTDQLTALANRRHWEEAASGELHRCARNGRPAVMLMIDLDGFKKINDRLGHAFGDEVLRRVALAIRGCVREIDTAARFGGDEFAVVLPETRVDTAVHVAARIRAAISAQLFERSPGLHCTASIGVAEVEPADGGLDVWLERADRALYLAKSDGRDCVRTAAG